MIKIILDIEGNSAIGLSFFKPIYHLLYITVQPF